MPTDTHTDTKGAMPLKPAAAKRSRLDEDEAAETSAAAPKQKMLPTGLSRAIVVSTLIFTVIFTAAFVSVELMRDRYGISPVPNSANIFVYQIDRLTGSLQFCGSQQCSVVQVRDAE